MADFPSDLLNRPAVDAAGLVALRYLDDATAAAKRLSDPTDAEALHNFRVSLRRLRVTVRAFPGLHEGVAKKQRRRLRRLARETNTIRDAEAQIAWFRDRSAQFTPAQRAALGALRARLRSRRRRAQAHTHLELQQRFEKLERKVRHAVTALRSRAGAGEPPFRSIVAAALVQSARDLRQRLEDRGATSPAELHTTRIAAKRLRYLLEPVESSVAQGTRLIDRLKQLQDLFGGLTDAHALQGELQRATGNDDQPGISAASNLLDSEVKDLLETVRVDSSAAGVEIEKATMAVAQRLWPAPRRVRAPKPPRATRRRARVPA
jgi:CHAD domain-containing protein